MTFTTKDARKFFAEDIRVLCNVRSPSLIRGLATIPRERFLPPGPWLVQGMYDSTARRTDDAEPRQVYHDFAVAIDPARHLFNGQPSLIVRWLETLAIQPGDRVLHIGCGTGYFTALIGQMVGPDGRVFAVDVDASLAERAREHLAEWRWIQVATGDGRTSLPANLDVVLVHAGATHVLDEWLDALAEGGRLLVPLTSTMPGMPATIGKGVVLMALRTADTWSARIPMMVAIYSLVGLRDDRRAEQLGQALITQKWPTVTRIRREPHAREATCFLHGETNCLSS